MTGWLLLTAGLWPSTAWSQDEGGADVTAQMMPRVSRSLLLDITRTDAGRFVAVGERGHILYSDTGDDWTQANEVPSRATLTSVAAAGDRLWAAGHDTDILASDDGGESWALLYRDIERQQPVLDLHFFDEANGMAVGAYGLAMFTTDGGETWDERVVSADEWHLNAILDRGNGRLLVAGEAGVSYASDDGGTTWVDIPMPYPGSMFGALQAAGCTWLFGLRGHVQRRCDDEGDWEEPATDTVATLLGGLADDGRLVLVGNSGTLLHGGNGKPFRVVHHSSGVDFSAIVQAGEGRYLLTGEGGVHHYPERDAP
ncbi:hypothetical protein F3N42_12070 [Marinihelvus fidelis]|uniref:Photosynthesis system II assembly factor Ycf48/Hcf136-like domain-containing protein n=1 Tax=Marinihelvus fidelis TaxID=2613842 RepID=A0A5N0T6P5_9GAMM|nr:YCF48-related protein [Marinihelvus fidelis]KAA9130438.1 hypothetical protein F3N42_12070 [Marinihelvus fidelis]